MVLCSGLVLQLCNIESKRASLGFGRSVVSAAQGTGNGLSLVKRCSSRSLSDQDPQLLSADRVWFCSSAASWQYFP